MYEKEFNLVEGQTMTFKELGKEIEAITGKSLVDTFGNPKRVVVKKPAPEQDFETFDVTYQLENSKDYVSGVVTTKGKKKLTDYNLKEESFKVRLLSYNQRDEQ